MKQTILIVLIHIMFMGICFSQESDTGGRDIIVPVGERTYENLTTGDLIIDIGSGDSYGSDTGYTNPDIDNREPPRPASNSKPNRQRVRGDTMNLNTGDTNEDLGNGDSLNLNTGEQTINLGGETINIETGEHLIDLGGGEKINVDTGEHTFED